MTPAPPPGPGLSRETRLLLLTVAVCAVMLLVLARVRFPDAPPATETSTPPLERLAARASYDALAADIDRVEPIIASNLAVLRIVPPLVPAPRGLADLLARPAAESMARHVPALRLDERTAIAALDDGARIDGLVGGEPGGNQVTVVARDPLRRLARLQLPAAAVRALVPLPLAALATPVYVVIVEGTQAGVTLRPVFLGRGEPFASMRWSQPLLPVGGAAVSAGALVFSLAGEFIGTVVSDDGAAAIAGAQDLFATALRLAGDPPAPVDLGVALQPLTPDLAEALGAPRGAVVAEVDPGGPAAGLLEPMDVVTAVDDWAADDPDAVLMRVAGRVATTPVVLTIGRRGETRTVTLPPGGGTIADARPVTALSLEHVPGQGARVVDGAGPRGQGLRTGDLVIRVGDVTAPTPVQVRRWLATPRQRGMSAVLVRRDGRSTVVAVPSAGQADAAR
jgi:hypothetical protein